MNFKGDSRYLATIAAFDALNAEDPNSLEVLGESQPKELHDALAMTRWVEALYPDANEAVHLASRCQHLCRWESPRSHYPEGRAGYHRWRTDLKQFHADKSAAVMHENGYDDAMIDSVRSINLKQDLKSNPNVQKIEDALCLVFLETQFESYLVKWEDDKIIRILKKTWVKMSESAHQAALELDLSDRALDLIRRALAE